MGALVQKKFPITRIHKDFLEDCKKWGFSDQSSMLRAALSRFIKDLAATERKRQMEQKALELLADYTEDKELIAFTDLDGEDFYETGRNLGH
jgi:membrane-bound lytic murein transglycosylase MltF